MKLLIKSFVIVVCGVIFNFIIVSSIFLGGAANITSSLLQDLNSESGSESGSDAASAAVSVTSMMSEAAMELAGKMVK